MYFYSACVDLSWSPASRWIRGSTGHHGHSWQSMCRQPESPSQYWFLWSPHIDCSTAGASPGDTHLGTQYIWAKSCTMCLTVFNTTKTSSLAFIHLITNMELVGFYKRLTCSEMLYSKATETRNICPASWRSDMIIQWLPETQTSGGHHTGTVGHPDLRGCAARRPTGESLPDCNAPPEHNKTRWDGHKHQQYSYHFISSWVLVLTWWGSGAVFLLKRWNTLLSSVSCMAISSRSVSAKPEWRIKTQPKL